MVRERAASRDSGFTEDEINGGGLQITTTFTKKAMDAAEQGVRRGAGRRAPATRPARRRRQRRARHRGGARASTAARTTSTPRSTGRSPAAWPAPRSSRSRWRPRSRTGFSLKDTFDGNSPFELPDGTDEVENQGDDDYGSAVNLITATENSINTAFIDMTTCMDERPAEGRGRCRTRWGSRRRSRREGRLGFPTRPRASSRSPASRSASRRSARSTWPTPTPPSPTAAGRAPLHHREGRSTATARTLYDHTQVRRDRPEQVAEDIAADVTYALQQVVQAGSGTAALGLGRPAAGKTGTATKARGVSSAWFTGYTPQLATSVMYVRGKGNEQLDGWLPSTYFGGDYPAETWTAVMQRAMEGLAVEDFPPPAYVDGDAPDEGHEPYAPPPPTKPPPQPPPPTESDEPTKRPPSEPTPTPTADADPDPDADAHRPDHRRPAEPDARPPSRRGDGHRRTAAATRDTVARAWRSRMRW